MEKNRLLTISIICLLLLNLGTLGFLFIKQDNPELPTFYFVTERGYQIQEFHHVGSVFV